MRTHCKWPRLQSRHEKYSVFVWSPRASWSKQWKTYKAIQVLSIICIQISFLIQKNQICFVSFHLHTSQPMENKNPESVLTLFCLENTLIWIHSVNIASDTLNADIKCISSSTARFGISTEMHCLKASHQPGLVAILSCSALEIFSHKCLGNCLSICVTLNNLLGIAALQNIPLQRVMSLFANKNLFTIPL